MRNVFATLERLISNVFYHGEPVGQLNLNGCLIVAEKLQGHIDELIHEDWEDGHTDDLNKNSD